VVQGSDRLGRMMGWSSVQLSARATVAALASLLVARWLQLEYPIYAFIGAVIVTDLQPSVSRSLGLRRLFATVIGAFCGAALSVALPAGPLAVAVGFFLSMSLAQLLRAGEGARVAGYICGIVLLDHSTEPWAYASHRFIETAIGVLAAWSISYVPKLFDSDIRARPH
jgi:uncharacterized membrane protein YgaE (UPF0421/DUF939 family)